MIGWIVLAGIIAAGTILAYFPVDTVNALESVTYRLVCHPSRRHRWKTLRVIYGDEIRLAQGRRFWWKCQDCSATKLMDRKAP